MDVINVFGYLIQSYVKVVPKLVDTVTSVRLHTLTVVQQKSVRAHASLGVGKVTRAGSIRVLARGWASRGSLSIDQTLRTF